MEELKTKLATLRKVEHKLVKVVAVFRTSRGAVNTRKYKLRIG